MNILSSTMNGLSQHKVIVLRLKPTDYKSCWDLQRQIFDLRAAGKISDTLLLTEHRHVYTLGKNSNDNHLLADDVELRSRGIEIFHIDRGGDITYHGPGQLVGYPILDLNGYYRDIHRYLRDLEEVILKTLTVYGIEAHRETHYTGVWAGLEKIAAIGVKVSRWITMHGFALNVNTNLSYFDRIIPCGIFHKGVTSVERLLGRQVPLDEVSTVIVQKFSEVFGVQSHESDLDGFYRTLSHDALQNLECQPVENK